GHFPFGRDEMMLKQAVPDSCDEPIQSIRSRACSERGSFQHVSAALPAEAASRSRTAGNAEFLRLAFAGICRTQILLRRPDRPNLQRVRGHDECAWKDELLGGE